MNRPLGVLSGVGLGAGLMYFLDPDRGATRRARVRDKVVRVRNDSGRFFGKAVRDLGHRARGAVASTKARFRPGSLDDTTLTERIRSKMGRLVSHPHAIRVTAMNGHITLSGPILRSECERLMGAMSRIRGVKVVDNYLDIHDVPDLPALQGGHHHNGTRPEWVQAEWSPSMRLAAGVAGTSLVLWGITQRSLIPMAMGLLGAGLLVRSVPRRRLVAAAPESAQPPAERAWAW